MSITCDKSTHSPAIDALCTGARETSFRNIESIAECLVDELIKAAKGSSNGYAIKKKDEHERIAMSVLFLLQISPLTVTPFTVTPRLQ